MYDVTEALKSRAIDSNWAMNQHRDIVTPGDRIFFWRSGPEAAIVAVGHVISPVYERSEESQFGRYAVDVEYEYSLDPILTREDVKYDSTLVDVKVFTRAQGTNFALTDEQGRALEALVRPRWHRIGVGVAAAVVADPMREITKALRHAHQDNVHQIVEHISTMDPYTFEWLVAAVLVRSGYTDVDVTPRSGDKGIDVRATIMAGGFAPLKVFVQAKRSPSVGSPAVQKLRGSCPSGHSAMLVASGDFTQGARDEAADPTKHNSVTLVTGQQLAELMLQYGVGTERKPLETHTLVFQGLLEPNLRAIVQVPDA